MKPGAIIAIGIGVATALVMALVAARRAGCDTGPDALYGRELDAPDGMWSRRRARPLTRQRAMLALMMVAIAALGAGLAVGLSDGNH